MRSSLLLFVAGLLLLWLSGGIPPAPWLLLIQAIMQFGAPWGQPESAIQWLFILLIVQSLALGAAWFFFVWAIIRETRSILNIRARLQQTVPITVSTGIKLRNASSLSSTPAQRSGARRRDEQDFSSEWGTGAPQAGTFPENPFEEPGPGQSDYPLVQNAHNSPFDIQGDVYSVFRRPYSYGANLDVSEEIQEKEEDDIREEESPFRYGNPFEGSLPEVFSYDVDLRRSILEVEAEITQIEIDSPRKNQLEVKADKKGPSAHP
ncbi:hypothetical protein KSF_064290 [Reticulibacter mediterranei]|uniref:Uncharacterized protein n=1 Tax=Reticulibacter mediterranei TaxID=2778369 RepID=A0A8J3IW40_9CHLR|nr:hypothetical protein [Reticulibacter mediterranei]GHO96381.1 hypothetical protein KSF_064290 [Reticulibacter mediterranei]